MTRLAALHWRDPKSGKKAGYNMMPYGDHDMIVAIHDEMVAAGVDVKLTKAHFPRWIDGTSRGCLAAYDVRAVDVGHGIHEIREGGRVLALAEQATEPLCAAPFWRATVAGGEITAGALDALVLEVWLADRDSSGPAKKAA